MGSTKTEIFSSDQIRLAKIARALAHPARIAILQYLSKLNGCQCGELTSHIGLAQSTVSQHLKALKSTGIIRGDIEGPSVCYCIENKVFEKLSNELIQFLINNPTNQNC